ncbi:MAG TPA: peptidoglycan-binding protein [Candidatus Binatia bacterium]|nr:peptidoglycan-binding protein [Candidatus Binatia bacterium]
MKQPRRKAAPAARPKALRAAGRRPRAMTFLGAVEPVRFPGRVIQAGESDPTLVLAIQQRLNTAGCGPVDKDGIFGPQTKAAVQLFQTRFPDADGQPLKADGMVGAVTWAALFGRESVPTVERAPGALLKAVLDFAGTQVGVMESPPGSNRGPQVDAYLRSVGLDPAADSFPWCAAFVYFCFKSAASGLGRSNPVVKTAGVLDHWNVALQRRIPTLSASKAHLREDLVHPGHIFVIDTGAAGGAGHTGLVEAIVAGKLVTIEGNTNDGGSREGIGVFRRESRRIRDVNVGFIDYGEA